MSILEVKNLCKSYKGFDLNNVSFDIPEGTIMGLIGENGAGKSTIINIITNAVHKDSGTVKLFGVDLENCGPDIWNSIAVVQADCGFPEELTIKNAESVLKGIYKNWDSGKFESYINKLGLDFKKKIKSLSTGMKMKFELAIALSHSAKLLILDEATNGLDFMARNEILDILMDFIQDESCGVLLASHIIEDMERICDYITFIHNGNVVFSENKDDLLDKYAVINIDENKLSELDSKTVVYTDKTQYSSKALVYRNQIPSGFETEKTTIQDIMYFYMKGGK